MSTRFNPKILNHYLAPGIAGFSSIDAPDLEKDYPQADHWLTGHFLNSILRGGFTGSIRQYSVNLIFRAQSTFFDYSEARCLTFAFLEKSKPYSPCSRLYFRAVSRWESCFLSFQIFLDILTKLRQESEIGKVFEKHDGTPEQRAFDIANTIKHWGSDICSARAKEEHTIPLWLTDTGFHTRLNSLTYLELGNLISKVAEVANQLQDPKSFIEEA